MVSVCAGSLGGWDDEAGSLSRSDTGFVSLSPCAVPSGTVSSSWYTLRVVTGGFRPYFRRYDVLHIGPGVCLLCRLARFASWRPESISSRSSTSSPPGLRYEGVALNLMTSEPLFSFSTPSSYWFLHVRHVPFRSPRDVHRFPLCDQPTLIEMYVVLLSQPRELLKVFDLMVSNTPPSRTTEESEICMDFLWRRSNDVAPPLCG